MTSDEWTSVEETMCSLWPKLDLNHEIAESWKRVLIGFDAGLVSHTLRKWKDRNTKYPHPKDIANIINPSRANNPGVVHEGFKPLSRWEVQRQQWAKSNPAKREHYLGMLDIDVELSVARSEYATACEQAGRTSQSAAFRFRQLLSVESKSRSPNSENAERCLERLVNAEDLRHEYVSMIKEKNDE